MALARPCGDNVCLLARWEDHVERWGLSVFRVKEAFGAPGSETPAHIVEFTNSTMPPNFLSVTSFWGNNVFGFMRETMQSLILEGGLKGRGLTHFQGRDKEWYNALVWSDANKATTREQVRPREPGFWWPAIAIIMVGERTIAQCQVMMTHQI